jgi:hypothetical protein
MEDLAQVSFGHGRRLLAAVWLVSISIPRQPFAMMQGSLRRRNVVRYLLLSLFVVCMELVCRCAGRICPSPHKRTSRAKTPARPDLYLRTSTTGHHMVQLTIQDMELHRMMSL